MIQKFKETGDLRGMRGRERTSNETTEEVAFAVVEGSVSSILLQAFKRYHMICPFLAVI